MNNKFRLSITNFCTEKNKMWCMAADFNGLFEIDLENDAVKYLGTVPKEELLELNLYAMPVKYEDKLVFPPDTAKEIAIYDLKKRNFIKLEIKESRYNIRETEKFTSAIVDGGYVYLIPCLYSAIVRLDMSDYNITYITDWYDNLWKEKLDWINIYQNVKVHIDGDVKFLIGKVKNGDLSDVLLGTLDLHSKQVHTYSMVEIFKQPYSAMCVYQQEIAFVDINDNIVYLATLDTQKGDIQKKDLKGIKLYHQDYYIRFMNAFTIRNHGLYWLTNSEQIVVYDFDTKELYFKDIPFDKNEELNKDISPYGKWRINVVEKIGEVIYFQDAYNNILYEWHYFEDVVKKHQFVIDSDILCEEIQDKMYDFVRENRMGIRISEFINNISSTEKSRKIKANGSKIYEAMNKMG